jgi:hypothetical protein
LACLLLGLQGELLPLDFQLLQLVLLLLVHGSRLSASADFRYPNQPKYGGGWLPVYKPSLSSALPRWLLPLRLRIIGLRITILRHRHRNREREEKGRAPDVVAASAAVKVVAAPVRL